MSLKHLDAPIRAAWSKAPFSMLWSTWFGIGHIPGGPGTYAAIATLPLIWWVSCSFDLVPRLLGLLALTVASCVWCDRAGKALDQPDSRHIVIDEVLGIWVTLIGWSDLGFWPLAIGCAAFRVFDIKKPWPIRALDQKVKGGVGVVVDDLVAGLYAVPFAWAAVALG